MSVVAVTWALAMKSEHKLTHAEHGILAVLGYHANEDKDWQAWPSRRTIAKKAGCGADAVQRALPKFADLGLITIAKSDGPRRGESQPFNVYTLIGVSEWWAKETKQDEEDQPAKPLRKGMIKRKGMTRSSSHLDSLIESPMARSSSQNPEPEPGNRTQSPDRAGRVSPRAGSGTGTNRFDAPCEICESKLAPGEAKYCGKHDGNDHYVCPGKCHRQYLEIEKTGARPYSPRLTARRARRDHQPRPTATDDRWQDDHYNRVALAQWKLAHPDWAQDA